jgi:competence protein ComEC
MTDVVFPGGRVETVSPPGFLRGFAERLADEGERRFLWLPVFFGAGIGIYFSLQVEPPLWPAIATAVAGIALALVLRRAGPWCEAALAFSALAAGFALMCETAWGYAT